MKKWIVPNVFAIIIFGVLALILSKRESLYVGSIFVDAFMITGAFLLMGAGIVAIDQEGTFDILSYGVKKIARFFKKNMDDNFPKSYQEYVEMRRGQKKIMLYPTVLVGAGYLLIGLIIYLIEKVYLI